MGGFVLRIRFRLAERRQEHARQDRDDGDDDKEFDQSKGRRGRDDGSFVMRQR